MPVLATLLARFQTSTLRDEVADPASWPALINDHTQTRMEGYRAGLGRVLSWSGRFYGTAHFGGQSLTRCWQVAFMYPPVALILGWMLFDVGVVGGLEMLPEGEWDPPARLWRGALLIGIMGINFVFFRFALNNFNHIELMLCHWVRKFDNQASFISKTARWISLSFMHILPFVVGAIGIAVSFAITVSFNISAVFALPTTLTAAVVVNFYGAFAASLASFGVVAFFAARADPTEASTSLLFLSILPFLNGLADFVSVGFTRHFLNDICVHQHRLRRILRDLVLDLGVAAICLIGLLGAFVAVLELWAALLPNTLAFDWQLYVDDIRAGDWGKATMLVTMAVTTLIPTMVHLVAGVAGFAASESKSWHRAVAAMQEKLDTNETAAAVRWVNTVTRDIRRGVFWGWFKAMMLALPVGVLAVWGLMRVLF